MSSTVSCSASERGGGGHVEEVKWGKTKVADALGVLPQGKRNVKAMIERDISSG